MQTAADVKETLIRYIKKIEYKYDIEIPVDTGKHTKNSYPQKVSNDNKIHRNG